VTQKEKTFYNDNNSYCIKWICNLIDNDYLPYGNAIVIPQAVEFIRAYMGIINDQDY
jgi:hypothetical protein